MRDIVCFAFLNFLKIFVNQSTDFASKNASINKQYHTYNYTYNILEALKIFYILQKLSLEIIMNNMKVCCCNKKIADAAKDFKIAFL